VYRPFQFHKRSQDFIGAHDETLSIAMRVSNPDCPSLTINGQNAAPTPSGLAEIVCDEFPSPSPLFTVFHYQSVKVGQPLLCIGHSTQQIYLARNMLVHRL